MLHSFNASIPGHHELAGTRISSHSGLHCSQRRRRWCWW